jgi:hypothetical protein
MNHPLIAESTQVETVNSQTLAYSNCLYLVTQPDLSPPETALLEISIVILGESTRSLLNDNDKP